MEDQPPLNDKHCKSNVLKEILPSQPLIEIEPENRGPILTYLLESKPPIIITLFTALQHVLLAIPACLFQAVAAADVACVPFDHPVRPKLFCGALFMSGICTILQVGFGVRLPVFQGPSISFLVPLLALKSSPGWICRAQNQELNYGNGTTIGNFPGIEDEMYSKLQLMSGSLMLSSLLEIAMGSLGILGLILRFVGPITVSVFITLIGLSLIELPIIYGRPCYPVEIGCTAMVIVFILYCQNVKVPLPKCGKNSGNKKRSYFAVFQLLPILVGLSFWWLVSWLLTTMGVFTDDKNSINYQARTDANYEVIANSPWINFSYPLMFGLPRMDLSLALAFAISSVSSMFESVGDYYATQKACQVERIPKHAISRGILTEGIGVFLSGAVGVGYGTTSYSGNIGLLILSKNASRVVMYTVGFMMIVFSLFGKLGGVLTAIPNPVLGGVMTLILATVVAVGLSNLQHVDMSQTRNLIVVGVPLIVGMAIPKTLEMYPDIIDAGETQLNQIIEAVIGSPMFLGGILSMVLDNTVPGSDYSRGITYSNCMKSPHRVEKNQHIYSWSFFPKIVRLLPCFSFIPFFPPKISSKVYYGNEDSMDVV